MTSLSLKHRIFLVKSFYKLSESIKDTQLAFRREFKVGHSPSFQTIVDLVEKFEVEGSVKDRPQPCRPKRVRNEENIEQVKTVIERTPTKSIRKVSSEVEISRSIVQRILTIDLKMQPFKATLVHGLHEDDLPKRVEFCEWFLERQRHDPQFLHSIFFSDEASFHLTGSVNRQNERYWGIENPRALVETKSFTPKVNVWVAMSSRHIIGPFFFEDEEGKSLTINSDRYIGMLEQFFLPELRRRRVRSNSVWFQHDLATPHTSAKTVAAVEAMFPDKVIGKGSWPPRSPDISPLDSFLFGYLKGKVYKEDPQDIAKLKQTISREIEQLTADTLKTVFVNIHTRVQKCRLMGGGHFQHLLK